MHAAVQESIALLACPVDKVPIVDGFRGGFRDAALPVTWFQEFSRYVCRSAKRLRDLEQTRDDFRSCESLVARESETVAIAKKNLILKFPCNAAWPEALFQMLLCIPSKRKKTWNVNQQFRPPALLGSILDDVVLENGDAKPDVPSSMMKFDAQLNSFWAKLASAKQVRTA